MEMEENSWRDKKIIKETKKMEEQKWRNKTE